MQTGFQTGTFNALPDTAAFSNEVKPEELKSYTVGIKSRWFDDRLQINDEIYYYDFHNLIIQSYDISAPYNLIFNGNKVAIKGNQLDILTRVFTDDQANLNIAYSHARNIDVVDTKASISTGWLPHMLRIGSSKLAIPTNMAARLGYAARAHRLAIRKQVVGGLCAQQGHRANFVEQGRCLADL